MKGRIINMNEYSHETKPETGDSTAISTGVTTSYDVAKKVFFLILGIVLTAGFLFLTILHGTTFTDIECSIDPITYEDTPVIEISKILIHIVLPFVIATLSFVFLVLPFIGKLFRRKFQIRIVAIILFAAAAIATLYGTYYFINDHYQTGVRLEIDHMKFTEKRTLKYTEMTIEDFQDDVNRYPIKYDGKLITLEGTVKTCLNDTFNLIFPNDESGCNVLVVNYAWDESTPRVSKGDYVVVTGYVEVYFDEKTQKYRGALVDAICNIKSLDTGSDTIY